MNLARINMKLFVSKFEQSLITHRSSCGTPNTLPVRITAIVFGKEDDASMTATIDLNSEELALFSALERKVVDRLIAESRK